MVRRAITLAFGMQIGSRWRGAIIPVGGSVGFLPQEFIPFQSEAGISPEKQKRISAFIYKAEMRFKLIQMGSGGWI